MALFFFHVGSMLGDGILKVVHVGICSKCYGWVVLPCLADDRRERLNGVIHGEINNVLLAFVPNSFGQVGQWVGVLAVVGEHV
jgi:hypothetical protein